MACHLSASLLLCLPHVSGQNSSPSKTNESLGVTFVNVAPQAGLTAKTIYGDEHRNRYLLETTGSGAAFVDYDNDGWQDIFLASGTRIDGLPPGVSSTNRLYRNDGNGKFSDVTEKAGLVRTGWAQAVCVGDYENDGYDDLFVSSYGKNALYHNNGTGTFKEVAEKAGVANNRTRWGSGCGTSRSSRTPRASSWTASPPSMRTRCGSGWAWTAPSPGHSG